MALLTNTKHAKCNSRHFILTSKWSQLKYPSNTSIICITRRKMTNHLKAILKKLSVGGNTSGKKTVGREGIFIFFKEPFQILRECCFCYK